MAKLNSIKKLTDNKFLNLHEADFTNEKTGKDFKYFIASRRSEEELACKTKDHTKCDAVMIVPVDDKGGIYLIKQFRPAINDYIIECPAGLVDSNEKIEVAAARELFEETGLRTKIMTEVVPPCYNSAGMSDETVAIYMANVEGEPNLNNKEENEDIEILHITPNEFFDVQNGKYGPVAIKTHIILSLLSSIGLADTLTKEILERQ